MKLKNYPERHFKRQYHSRLYGWRDSYHDDPDLQDQDMGCLMAVLAVVVVFVMYCLAPVLGVILGVIAIGFAIRVGYMKHIEKQNAYNWRNHPAEMMTRTIRRQHEREKHQQR